MHHLLGMVTTMLHHVGETLGSHGNDIPVNVSATCIFLSHPSRDDSGHEEWGGMSLLFSFFRGQLSENYPKHREEMLTRIQREACTGNCKDEDLDVSNA